MFVLHVSEKDILSWYRSSILTFYLIIKHEEEGQVAELPLCIVLVTLMNFGTRFPVFLLKCGPSWSMKE